MVLSGANQGRQFFNQLFGVANHMALAYLLRTSRLIAHLLESVCIIADHHFSPYGIQDGRQPGLQWLGILTWQFVYTQDHPLDRIYHDPNRHPFPIAAHTGHIGSNRFGFVAAQQLPTL